MQIFTLNDKAELLSYRDRILTLFADCFGSRMPAELWHWAYIDNPHGAPFVTLCLDGADLVAHYAVIPLVLRQGATTRNALLSMTTMVAPTHRKHGLFTTLALKTYEAASAAADYVIGFPNQQSAPGFRKYLGWTLPHPDHVVRLDKQTLLRLSARHGIYSRAGLDLDLQCSTTRDWRLAKPGCAYRLLDGMVVKQYGDTLDLVYCEADACLESLPEQGLINVLLPGDIALPDGRDAFEYQFGGRALRQPFDPSAIRRSLLLSDVF